MTENEKREETALETRLLDEAAAKEEWPPVSVRRGPREDTRRRQPARLGASG